MGQLEPEHAVRTEGIDGFVQRRFSLPRQVLPDAIGNGLIERRGPKRQTIEIGADEMRRVVASQFPRHAPRRLHRR